VETDYFEIADYFKTILNSNLKKKCEEEAVLEIKPVFVKLPSVHIKEKMKENSEIVKKIRKEDEKNEIKTFLNNKFEYEPSLIESVYELVDNNDAESSFMTNPIQFNSPLLKKSVSEQPNKKKFIVAAVENQGKVNFKSSFPDQIENYEKSQELGKPELHKSISDISFDFMSFHQTLIIEKNVKILVFF